MRQIYVFLFLSFYFIGPSQNFTNGSVYNYNVGDTIVTARTDYTDGITFQGIITYTYRIFTSKHYSSAADTVFYSTHEVYHTPQQCSNCTDMISSVNVNFYVTDLANSALNFTLSAGTCPSQLDSNYLDECNRNAHHRYLDFLAVDTCSFFETYTRDYKFIEGVGEFREIRTRVPPLNNNYLYNYKTQLVSVHKVGENCGLVGAIPDGIRELFSDAGKLKIFPNPSKDKYTIDANEEGVLTVIDFSGREILTELITDQNKRVNLINFSEGVYTFKFRTATRNYLARVVKE